MPVKLTERQKRFCDEYLIDLNATQAAIRAGYSEKTADVQGARLLGNVKVQSYLQERMSAKDKDLIASQDEVLQYLTGVVRGETQSAVLCLCGDGCQKVVQKAPDEKERLRAAELLGKRYSLFTDKVEHGGAVPIVIVDGDKLED